MVKKKKKKTGYMIKDGILEKVPEKEVEEKTEEKASIIIPSLETATGLDIPSVSVDLRLPIPKTLDLIRTITQEIFHDIVAPVCSVPGMNFNIFTAKFSDYDNASPKYRKQILNKILEKYTVDRNILETLQDLPMSLTAMYVVEKM